MSITSGIDWFDIKTIIEYGNQQISLHEVRKALKPGEHYIKLSRRLGRSDPGGMAGEIQACVESGGGNRLQAEAASATFTCRLIDPLLEQDATTHTPPGPATAPRASSRF